MTSSTDNSCLQLQPPHVAVFAFPFASHPGSLFAFSRLLADAAAPDTKTTFSFFTSPQSLTSLSKLPRSENLRLYHVDDGCSSDVESSPGDLSLMERIGFFLRATPGNLRAGIEEAVREVGGLKVTCVVGDAFLWMAGDVAEEMGVPWVPLWTCGTASLLAHLNTDELRRTIGVYPNQQIDEADPVRARENLHFIPGLSSLRVRDLSDGIVFGNINIDLSIHLHRMASQLPRAAAVALNTFQGLDPDLTDTVLTTKFKKCLPIGPMNLIFTQPANEPAETFDQCMSWLDQQETATVAYISFGTIMMHPQAELSELAHGLEGSCAPFLWSLNDKAKENLPSGFLDRTKGRGLIVSWAPQAQVLAHRAVGVSVTHCGWNSLMECITNGVPMICRAFMADQKTNARMVSQVYKIGVTLDGRNVAREEVAMILNLVLRGEEGKKMRERLCELRERAVQCCGPGGSSTKNLNSLLDLVCRRR